VSGSECGAVSRLSDSPLLTPYSSPIMADVKMPLTEHLEELRWRLIRSLLAIFLGAVVCYSIAEILFDFLIRPLSAGHNEAVRLIGTGVAEAFFTKLKVSLIGGVFLASPVIFYQSWRFVAPGLYAHEKRYVVPFVACATVFFIFGAGFCYAAVFPVSYRFFLDQYETIGIEPAIRISEYLSFSARMLLAFGITFELPVVTFFLARLGMVTHRTMLYYLRYAILGIFILAAVLTPGPDVASQLLLAAPLLVLYGISIGVAYVFARKPASEATETQETD
jgi:sec-independent protein translocase protein TatC